MKKNIDLINTEIGKFLKDSLIEREINFFLDNKDVPINLRNDIKFISLVCDKLCADNEIHNLKEIIQEDYLDGTSPEDINAFYSESEINIQKELEQHNNTINKLKTKYNLVFSENKKLDTKINSMIVNSINKL
ncbi:hypothetical protein [Clostridium estertheticum]|uniref:hypothetical protein n=1 Tax=Clostridium estertheticum TaxID=238834 RepID=UPI001C0AFAF4|nr:hypothetical protein [Clostridium estertheticum]MBU3174427.1 hypothetical protein [Clostridium estertheticum]